MTIEETKERLALVGKELEELEKKVNILKSKIIDLAEDTEIDHLVFGKGIIYEVDTYTSKTTTYAICDFNEGKDSYTFDLFSAFRNKYITTTNEDLLKLVNELKEVEKERAEVFIKQSELQGILAAERERLYQLTVEAQKRNKEEAKKQAKLARKKETAKKKFDSLVLEAKKVGLDINDTDVVIGWLAKHTKNIIARMPDFLEDRFVATFGDVEHTVTDSNKRTVNGFPMQWAFSGHITVDTLDSIPPVLENRFNKKKTLNDSAFVLGLIWNYGFTFGKKQNVEEIKKCVQNDIAFETGFTS